MMHSLSRAPALQEPIVLSGNSIGARLRHEMHLRGLTAAELAKHSGVKTSFLYDILRGKSAHPSPIKLAQVSAALGIDLGYLVGNTEAQTGALSDMDLVFIASIGIDDAGRIVSHPRPDGQACFSHAWIVRQFGISPADLRVFRIRGDCMQPTLCHNDTLLIDTTQKHSSPPGIFVLSDGVGLLARRLEYVTKPSLKRIRILPDNPYYSAEERPLDDICIVGRAVWFARAM